MIVLDTNVLSEPLRKAPDTAVLAWFAFAQQRLVTTSVSASELLYGVQRLPEGARKQQLSSSVGQILETFNAWILPFDKEAAEHHSRLRTLAKEAGRALTVEDSMIAAICVSTKAAIATRNVKDFEFLGLEVINPWDFQ